MALHAAVIAALLVGVKPRPPLEADSPPGVSVVFDNGGAAQATAPAHQMTGPPELAQAPPPASAPPAASQPEVRLDMPEMSEMPLATLPAPAPQPAPALPATPAPRNPGRNARPAPHYTVMNNLSFGQPAPPVPFARRALNLDLSAADQDAMNGPELTVKGDAGADWNAALDRWVEAHKYYPDSAIAQNQQGNVRIHFTVDRQGNVSGLKLTDGSGSVFLDQAWLGLFQGARLPPFPPGAKDDKVTVDATMHYILLR